MFRRSKSTETLVLDEPAPVPAGVAAGKKGRPTPTRKEAEAARKARAKVPVSRKEQMAAAKLARAETSSQVRKALKNGDERYLPARDKGPVKRFVRDFVDARFSFIELVVPLMIFTLVLGLSGNPDLASIGSTVQLGIMLLVVLDALFLRFRLRGEIKRRFGDEALKGTTYYALLRAMQMRFMRLPKPQVKIGAELPATYR